MYGKDVNQEILLLLRQMNEKLDRLSGSQQDGNRPEETSAQSKRSVRHDQENERAGNQVGQNTMWNLTQVQYELSNELFSGIHKLKEVIQEGEKHTNRAKKKYKR